MRISTIVTSVIAGIVGIVMLTVLGGSWYTVDEGSRAVVKRYGEVVDVTGPGLHFKMPLISSVEEVSVQTFLRTYGSLSAEGGAMQAYSQDLQVADLVISVNFAPNADTVRDVIVKYGSLDNYLRRDVDPKVFQSVKATFAKYTAQSSNENQIKLGAAILEELQAIIPTSIVTIQSVQIEDISFSNKFETAMEERKMNEIAVEKQKQSNLKVIEENKQTVATAEADAAAAKAKADGAAYALKATAEAQADATRLAGEAEADAIRAKGDALKENAGLVALTTAERWDGKLPTTMLPNSTVPFLDMKGTVAP